MELAKVVIPAVATLIGAERALEAVQLLGTREDIDLVQRLAREFATEQAVDWQPLLASLRASLGSELGLGEVEGNLVHLRIVDPD